MHWFWTPSIISLACVLLAACGLGELIDPGPDGAAFGVASLTLIPADTTLDAVGEGFCYEWTARDSAGALVTDVEPVFSLDSLSPRIVTLVQGSVGCVLAVAHGGSTPARVVAHAGRGVAEAVVRVRNGATSGVASLTIAPADTTLTEVGARVCYRWTARDGAGQELRDVVPVFSLRANPQGHIAQSDPPEAHCFSAVSLGVVNTTVDAAVDTVTASATLRVRR